MPTVQTDLRLLKARASATINGATGGALDTLAATYGVTRSGGESDLSLTARVADAIVSQLITDQQ